MAAYRVTLIIGDRNLGASETWITPANTSAATALANIQALINARNKLLPDNYYWVGVRISQWADPANPAGVLRRSQLLPPGVQTWKAGGGTITVPATGAVDIAANANALYPDQFRAVAQLRLTFDTDRTTTRYMVGFPRAGFDGVSEAWVPAAATPAFRTALTNYINLLVANWQLQALDRTAGNLPLAPIGVATGTQVPPLIGVIFGGATPAGWAQGARIQLQGFRPAKGTRNATLNGTWYIDSISQAGGGGPWTAFLRGSAGIIAADQRFTDKTRAYLYKNTLYGLTFAQIVRAGIHKRGRPTGSPRGRRLSRPTLDP